MKSAAPDFITRLKPRIAATKARLAASPAAPQGLTASCHYALDAGGKYVRPVLAICAVEACTGNVDDLGLDAVISAVELMHTYSLIHDDLPAMDDDDLRRGRPTVHKAYDEATAILVGDALQARAFELLADAPGLSADQKIRMIKVLAQAAGMEGMVGGQYIDIKAVDSDMTMEELQAMHNLKTGALIRASLALGGTAADATQSQLSALDDYGAHIGLAFQVVDDILDAEGNSETLGKTQGKDADANKPTYVKLLGLDGAKVEAQRLLSAALAALDSFGESADPLRQLARYIVERDR